MRKRGEQPLALCIVCVVFFCLLLSGGYRLIGMCGEDMPEQTVFPMRMAFASAPAQRAETGAVQLCAENVQRRDAAPAPESIILCPRAVCDANGNVLGGQTYLRTVYQAFVLDDGFV